MVNLVAANGHPPEVMDLAFGIEALTLAWLAGQAERLPGRRPPGAVGHRRRGGPDGPRRPGHEDRFPHPGPALLPGKLANRLLARAAVSHDNPERPGSDGVRASQPRSASG